MQTAHIGKQTHRISCRTRKTTFFQDALRRLLCDCSFTETIIDADLLSNGRGRSAKYCRNHWFRATSNSSMSLVSFANWRRKGTSDRGFPPPPSAVSSYPFASESNYNIPNQNLWIPSPPCKNSRRSQPVNLEIFGFDSNPIQIALGNEYGDMGTLIRRVLLGPRAC